MFFTDASELIELQKRLPIGQFIQIDKVFFKENLDVDFFALRNVGKSGTGYFVSERLKDKIEKEGCTGIVFKEPNEIYP